MKQSKTFWISYLSILQHTALAGEFDLLTEDDLVVIVAHLDLENIVVLPLGGVHLDRAETIAHLLYTQRNNTAWVRSLPVAGTAASAQMSEVYAEGVDIISRIEAVIKR